MRHYMNEIIYACVFSVGLAVCAVCILLGHDTAALLALTVSSVFILLELYSLFIRIDGGSRGRVSASTASLAPDPYSMPDPYYSPDSFTQSNTTDDNFTFQDGIEAVSEPVIIHSSKNDKKQ